MVGGVNVLYGFVSELCKMEWYVYVLSFKKNYWLKKISLIKII